MNYLDRNGDFYLGRIMDSGRILESGPKYVANVGTPTPHSKGHRPCEAKGSSILSGGWGSPSLCGGGMLAKRNEPGRPSLERGPGRVGFGDFSRSEVVFFGNGGYIWAW